MGRFAAPNQAESVLFHVKHRLCVVGDQLPASGAAQALVTLGVGHGPDRGLAADPGLAASAAAQGPVALGTFARGAEPLVGTIRATSGEGE